MEDQETFKNLGITAVVFVGITIALVIVANLMG